MPKNDLMSALASYVGQVIIAYGTAGYMFSRDFNEGQQTVLRNSRLADLELKVTHYDTYIFDTIIHSQTLDRFHIDIHSPHPEAIDESISHAKEIARVAADYMDYGPSTEQFEDRADLAFEYYQRKIGYFV